MRLHQFINFQWKKKEKYLGKTNCKRKYDPHDIFEVLFNLLKTTCLQHGTERIL